jgi:hypothetical protein
MERLEGRCLFSSVAGQWCGTRTEAGLAGKFGHVAVELTLTQSSAQVTGTEDRTAPKAPQFFADLLTHGKVVGDKFLLRDNSIIEMRRPSNYKWLLYTATLRISSDGQTMTGRWHAGGVHGTMTFQRMPSGT